MTQLAYLGLLAICLLGIATGAPTVSTDDPDVIGKRLDELFNALPDNGNVNMLNMSAIIDEKNTTLGQLFDMFPELKDYNGILNPTQLKHVLICYQKEPTDYWEREKLVVDYLSDLPEDLKARLPPPAGFRTTQPEVRKQISRIMYASTNSGVTFWDKVLTVARYIQSLVPEVVEFKVNTTLELNGRYTRTALKNRLTADQFKEIDSIQRSSLNYEQKQVEIGAKLREFYRSEKEAVGDKEMNWPNMLNNDNLPPVVQDAIRHVWLDENGGSNLRPIYDVFANAIKPHIKPFEHVGKKGVIKKCVWVAKEELKAMEAQEEIDRLKAESASAGLFHHGNELDHTVTVQPPITSSSPQMVIAIAGDNLKVEKVEKKEVAELSKNMLGKEK